MNKTCRNLVTLSTVALFTYAAGVMAASLPLIKQMMRLQKSLTKIQNDVDDAAVDAKTLAAADDMLDAANRSYDILPDKARDIPAEITAYQNKIDELKDEIVSLKDALTGKDLPRAKDYIARIKLTRQEGHQRFKNKK